jgi:hypothetical protein
MKKLLLSLLVVMCLCPERTRASEYWISPVLAAVPGFGVGHYVEGRVGRGLMFLALDGAAAFTFATLVKNASNAEDASFSSIFTAALLGGAIGLSIKIWEINDVKSGPSKSAMLLPMPVNGSPGLMLSSRF